MLACTWALNRKHQAHVEPHVWLITYFCYVHVPRCCLPAAMAGFALPNFVLYGFEKRARRLFRRTHARHRGVAAASNGDVSSLPNGSVSYRNASTCTPACMHACEVVAGCVSLIEPCCIWHSRLASLMVSARSCHCAIDIIQSLLSQHECIQE